MLCTFFIVIIHIISIIFHLILEETTKQISVFFLPNLLSSKILCFFPSPFSFIVYSVISTITDCFWQSDMQFTYVQHTNLISKFLSADCVSWIMEILFCPLNFTFDVKTIYFFDKQKSKCKSAIIL